MQSQNACLTSAEAVSGCLDDGGVQTQPSSNVEGIGAAWHPPQQAVGGCQLHFVKLHACILKGAVVKLE